MTSDEPRGFLLVGRKRATENVLKIRIAQMYHINTKAIAREFHQNSNRSQWEALDAQRTNVAWVVWQRMFTTGNGRMQECDA